MEIEALTEAFAVSQVTLQENSTAAPNPHFVNLYKKKSSVSQDERRKRFLAAQKQKRFDYSNHARKLATNEWSDGEEEEEEEEEMDCEEYLKKPSRSYKNQLMMSEWLVDVPSDLATEWLLVLCPVGKRCLVISTRGRTKAYSRTGFFMKDFQSELPAGACKKIDAPLHKYTILDCIYHELTKTFYVLDLMCWNSHPCYDSDAEFRLYWKQEKLREIGDVQSKDNPYTFTPLTHFGCDAKSIHNALHSPLPFEAKLDGLLFFHRRSHYICRTSPLVTWLKAYMVPEMLNIEVPPSLCADKPTDYVSMEKLLPKAFEKNLQRKKLDEQNMQYED